MKKSQYLKQLFVDLIIKVDEILRFSSQTADSNAAIYKDLFRIKCFYFLFTYDRKGLERIRTLRQINKATFLEEKQKLLSLRPRSGCENWTANDGKCELKSYKSYTWKMKLPAENCIFFNTDKKKMAFPNPLKVKYEEAVQTAQNATTRQTPAVPKQIKDQIKAAMALSKELNINYENVRAIGTDKSILKEFKKSYEEALQNINRMTPAQCYEAYAGLKPTSGRSARKQILEKLGIRFFGADVKRLNLSELEVQLCQKVDEYHQKSVEEAIAIGINLSHDVRESMYNRMISTSREEKKKILSELGVDIQAIELNKYSLSPIKHALAASIGIDLEKN